MLRTLTVVLCLLSFIPAAVGAQGLSTLAVPPAIAEPASEKPTALAPSVNLSLPAATVQIAAAETTDGTATKSAPEQKQQSRSSFNWGNFAEVHLGDYRWIWWAGAAVALIAIHAGAN
ncbi:MAG: hypothetical protein PHI31_00655 [Desulfuromonadaceae bacterium]|nr:hypothetical protein [Desulfuromonadaceae bacterium]